MIENAKNTIRLFIYNNLKKHPSDIVALVAKTFDISRQRAHAHMAKEVKNGKITKIGRTSGVRYSLVDNNYKSFNLDITPTLDESWVWYKHIKPIVVGLPANIVASCNYGFTEILNNVKDHSEGTFTHIKVRKTKRHIDITIVDNGVGIFNKIQNALHIESVNEAILHLSKGKFTTDPDNHTGEGIFFTSRIFDIFSIYSDDLYYSFVKREWLLSSEKQHDIDPTIKGTLINMKLSLFSSVTPKKIMDEYTDKNLGFNKTIIAVSLSADPGDPHVSRSQAKRLLVGLEKFKNIVLDFKGVESVGPAFIDQIFRVFKNENPHKFIKFINTNKEVKDMIVRTISST